MPRLATWPDWNGKTAIVVATGPSASEAQLEKLKGLVRIIAIKSSWKLCPWADVLYGCDRDWWFINKTEGYTGLKASASPLACKIFSDIRLVRLVSKADLQMQMIGKVGCGRREGGGHSGFHAVNLAIQFGARRIALVGFDMRLDRGNHWHEPIKGVRPPDIGQMIQNRKAFDGCAPQFTKLGVEVVNASPASALREYPFVDLENWVLHGVREDASRAGLSRCGVVP